MQMVRCFILDQWQQSDKSQKKVIRLSMRSSHINRGLAAKNITVGLPMSGCVISKEDHRYLVSAGISGTHFFLPNKAIPKAKGELTVGQPIEGVCTVVNETARTAVLRAHPTLGKLATKSNKNQQNLTKTAPILIFLLYGSGFVDFC